jgi:hypothetical protein
MSERAAGRKHTTMLQLIIKGRTVVAVQWDSLHFMNQENTCYGSNNFKESSHCKKGDHFLAQVLELQLNFSIGRKTSA